jgi:hypothetical protein
MTHFTAVNRDSQYAYTVAAHPFLQKQSGPMRRQAHCGSDSQTKGSDHGQHEENPGAVENSPRHRI